MLGLYKYTKSYSRAILGSAGVVVKEQGSGNSAQAAEGALDDSDSQSSAMLETASLISCVTCLSDNMDSHSTDPLLLQSNTVIPYAKILNARLALEAPAEGGADDSFTEGARSVQDAEISSKPGSSSSRARAEGGMKSGGVLVDIVFAKPRRNDLVPKTVTLFVEYSSDDFYGGGEADVVEEILRRSYMNTKRNKSILVIINPYGGKGKAHKLYVTKAKPILVASDCQIDVVETKYSSHAAEIAATMDINKYDVIACASGDGIPHEVLNGLFTRPDRVAAFNKLAITQLPCGSGNAMSISCHGTSNPSYASLSLVKATEARVDLMCCTQPSYASSPRVSFLSQTYGVIAESDINTEFMRWIGPARFELGVTLNIFQRRKYPCQLYVKYAAKTKNELREHFTLHKARITQSFRSELMDSGSHLADLPSTDSDLIDDSCFHLKWSLDEPVPQDWEEIDTSLTDNLGIFYVGKMPYIAPDTKFFPAALHDDGAMDMVITDARTPLTRIAPILLSLDKGSHVLQPEVEHSKIEAYRLIPKLKSSIISVDGENFPFEPIQVEVLPRLAKTLLKNGCYVETEFEAL
ncbi:AGR256Wp [Eremothecium gossypii ATCC 10895]|uniref:sphingosine kinase n=1 Tax=Eremothecium gossypii (strain ATCC 10895 / CBS 109.51 / FGSC 9923 / NRRL Y-1056) TaxID=284811 RepID=Q74ZE3_EREGS|nr:AGR256Wp [Eremothecium gossypii ATCC 10895]AAS54746.1 AGR256Wp [Eremothecium gossypii ATCC 10895]AEY99077.1 FAGR256Wp [Eremothecium gossypii FDAG1]